MPQIANSAAITGTPGNAVVIDVDGAGLIDGGTPPGGSGTTNITITESPTGVLVASSSGTDDSIALVNGTNAGVMAPADKTKLDGVATGATAAGAAGDAYAISHEADATAHPASNIVNTPAGNIAATTVQAAINELDTEKQPVDATLTALAGLDTVAGVVYEESADTFGKRAFTDTASVTWDLGTPGQIKATAPAGGGNAFGTIVVAGQSNVVADAAPDTLTLAAGTNITLTTDASTDTVTIATTATANPNAIETDQAGEIAALTEKATPIAGDWALIEDSAAGNAKKKVQLGNIPGSGGLNEAQVDARIAAAGPAFAGTKSSPTVTARYLGAGTGSDQRAAIQALIDAFPTGSHAELEILGTARVDDSLTLPASNRPVSFTISGVGGGRIVGVGAGSPSPQNFHVLNLTGSGWAANVDIRIRDLVIEGQWDAQPDGAGKANASYRGIKVADARRVTIERCAVDNVRGFSISIDRCHTAAVVGNTVTRSGKDGISVSNTKNKLVANNTVNGCGDNAIACHSTTISSGTITNTNGTVQTTSGSPTVQLTISSSSGYVTGDVIVITTAGAVGGLNLKGSWVVTRVSNTVLTITHHYNATSTVGAGTQPGQTFDYDLGPGWTERQQQTIITGNQVANSFGIKVLGGPSVSVVGNTIKTVHGTGIHVGTEGAGPEGNIAFDSIVISGNTITDVIRKSYLNMSAPADACIYVDSRWWDIGSALITGNVLDCSHQLGTTTKPSDWARGLDQPYSGPASPQNGFFSANGYIDTAFGTEPCYQIIDGVYLRCRNGDDRSRLKVLGNSYYGIKPHRNVTRAFWIGARNRRSMTLPATNSDLSGASYFNGAPAIDLRPYYSIAHNIKTGNVNISGAAFTVKLRPSGLSTTFLESEATVDFVTAPISCNSSLNAEQNGAETVLPGNCRTLIEAVNFGYLASAPATDITYNGLICYADGDDCLFDVTYAPATTGSHEILMSTSDPDEQGLVRSHVACTQSYYDGLTAQQRAGIAFDIVGA